MARGQAKGIRRATARVTDGILGTSFCGETWPGRYRPNPDRNGKRMRGLSGVVLIAVALIALGGRAAAQDIRPEEVHDRLVAMLQANAHRPIAAGDTFVTWNPRPVLFTTVWASADSVSSSLVRADGLVGTADVRWQRGRPVAGRVAWTKPDSVALTFAFESGAQLAITRNGDADTLPLPEGFWAVADYGMEDQLLPVVREIGRIGGRHRVSVYRPYPGKWDRLFLEVRGIQGGQSVEIVDTEGKTSWWLLTEDGALVSIRRSEDAEYVRTPLINTDRFRDYLRLTGSDPGRPGGAVAHGPPHGIQGAPIPGSRYTGAAPALIQAENRNDFVTARKRPPARPRRRVRTRSTGGPRRGSPLSRPLSLIRRGPPRVPSPHFP